MSIAEQVESVLQRRGWSHGQAEGENGELCVVLASTEVTVLYSWRRAVDAAAADLFPGRVRYDRPLSEAAQVSDHPDTSREDISLILKHAQERFDALD